VLNALESAGIPVTGIGKISDIFAGSGISTSHPTTSNAHGMETISRLWEEKIPGLFFANLVDFDMLFGHRRNVSGYAAALEEFDLWLAGFLEQVEDEDLVLFTADHGNDPAWTGTDHTREQVPLFEIHRRQAGVGGLFLGFHHLADKLAAYFALEEDWRAAVTVGNRKA